MRHRNLILALSSTLMVCVAAFCALAGNSAPPLNLDETDTLIFFENFADSGSGWQTDDLTAVTTWHRDSFNAYGSSGQSWWCGDTLLGGYDNVILQYLDSPTLDLSAAVNPVLEFDVFWAIEGLGGEFPEGYDGWDGTNVLVSTDDGQNWQVLPMLTPAYSCTSSAAFGLVWGFGPGIASWTGFSGGSLPGAWLDATTPMAGFTSATTKLRFAIASDEQICTRGGVDLTGYFVDNLNLHDATNTYLQNNAEGLAIPSELVPVTGMGSHGQLWHIEKIGDPPPVSPDSLVMRLSNVFGEYDPNLNNALISPRISLEGYSPDSIEIQADFYIRGSLNVSDPDTFPNLDYWTVQVSPDDGANWYSYGDPWGQGNTAHLWIDANNNYTQFSEMIGGAFDLTPYAGYSIRIRILFVSDGDQYRGTGLFVDNVWVTTTQVGVNSPVSSEIPSQFSLGKNFPNPFNSRTSFNYSLPKGSFVKFSLYDAAGREISSQLASPLPQGWHEAGTYRADFDAAGLPSGIYLYRLQAGDFSSAGKMILLK